MATLVQPLAVPVGVYKQFGETGPVYQVIREVPMKEGAAMTRIVLVKTGEELDYAVAAILKDERAA